MSKRKPAQLTDTQLIILSSAAQRDDGLATLPETLKGSAAQKVVTKLTASGLLKEVRVKPDQPAWRTDDSGHSLGLKITKAGAAAIRVDEGSTDEADNSAATPSEGEHAPTVKGPAGAEAPRAGSKQALIISLLQREGGATLDDLIAETDWLPHTTRAALTGLRKKGYTIEKSKREDGKTVYALPSSAPSKPASHGRGARKRKAA
jgi:Protein of unknown function (DUF3489)